MEDWEPYIELLLRAPIALIEIIFIFYIFKLLIQLIEKEKEIIKELHKIIQRLIDKK